MASLHWIKTISAVFVLFAALAALAQDSLSQTGTAAPTHDRTLAHESSTALTPALSQGEREPHAAADHWSLLFVLVLATFVGLGVIARVSRLLHTPLMSLTNAISAIAVVGAIIVTGGDFPLGIRMLGFVALVASTTNIVSGFLITDRMLKMFKQREGGPR